MVNIVKFFAKIIIYPQYSGHGRYEMSTSVPEAAACGLPMDWSKVSRSMCCRLWIRLFR